MNILLFGIAREIAGHNTLALSEEEGIRTVGQLKVWLGQQYPAISKLSSLAVAVDSEYAADDQEILPGSEIAVIPPVSGG